jgi:beta-galactosidase
MFSQGTNPKGKGYYGKMFYYQTALNVKAVKSPLYSPIKKVNNLINKEKEELLLSETKADICIGLYLPYFYTELTTSQLLKKKRLDVEKLGLSFDPRFIREEILFNGLLRSLQTLNFNYDIEDLENSSIERLLKYKQMWVVTTEFMDIETQKFIASYVKAGGHLIIYPVIPTLDLYLNSCTVLKDEFHSKLSKSSSSKKVAAFGIEEVYTLFSEKQIFGGNEGEAISKTNKDEICGIQKKIGGGNVTILGYAFGYNCDEHLHLYEKIIKLDRIKRQAKVSDSEIQYVIRKGKKYSYMFLLNYHNDKKTFRVNSKKIILEPFSCKIIKTKKN